MAYERMADLYDIFMNDAPYDKWVKFTASLLGNKAITLADLGCGTGELTLRLAQKFDQVIGIDSAPEMLAYAEQKSRLADVSVQWVCQDIRSLDGFCNLGAAVSFCDVINYITSESELIQAFQQINNALSPGGIFLFDIHSIDFIRNYYLDQTFADVTDNAAYIWFCSEGEHSGEMYHDLTFFVKNKEGNYKRFHEVHYQRTFSVDFYKKILDRVGFENINIYGDFSIIENSVTENTSRIFFSAEKSK